jgi:hypothetical protein
MYLVKMQGNKSFRQENIRFGLNVFANLGSKLTLMTEDFSTHTKF